MLYYTIQKKAALFKNRLNQSGVNMKKAILILLLALVAVSFISAQNDLLGDATDIADETKDLAETTNAAIEEVEAGTFPLGEWLDPNYDAIWAFQNRNIILKQNGAVVYDFKGMMSDFKLGVSLEGTAEVKYRCDDTGRNYIFSMKKDSTDMMMHITKDSGIEYDITMKRQ